MASHSLLQGPGADTYWNSGQLVDLNGDTKPDLVYGTASGPLNYYRNTGSYSSPVWTVNTSLFGGVLDVGGASSPFFIDFDFDGDLDLVSGSQLGDIKYFKNTGSTSAPAWKEQSSYFSSIDHSIYASITLGDVNGDSLPDAVVGDLSGQLFYHQNTGSGFEQIASVLSGIDLGYTSVPRFIDLDKDSDLDLVAGNEDGNLFYFENTGTADSAAWIEKPGFFGNIDVGMNCVPYFGDLDLDGDLDLITGDLFHEVQFFRFEDGNWQEDASVVSGITAGQNAAPALADLDGDGDLDLTIGNYDGTFNYYENKNATFIATEENVKIPEIIILDGAYPNPFNNSTRISGRVATKGDLTLFIYNNLGQLVLELEKVLNSAGNFEFDITMPVTVSTGLYHYRIKLDSNSQSGIKTGKLVYLK